MFSLDPVMGYYLKHGGSGMDNFLSVHIEMLPLARPQQKSLQLLLGRSTFMINSMPKIEGTEDRRCWHGVVGEKGECLYLNRFFGNPMFL
jgi:hypothetical protein